MFPIPKPEGSLTKPLPCGGCKPPCARSMRFGATGSRCVDKPRLVRRLLRGGDGANHRSV